VTVPQVWGEEMVRVINQARIVLNFHFTPLPNTEHRLTESLACGCFVLSEPPTDPDLFTDGVHLVYFSRKDVGDKIAYYLAHEDEREAIARQGMEYVRARYSARQQLQRILEIGNQEIRKLGNLDNRETGKLGNWETGPNFLIS
jgi:spore maturation protein CgeB